MRSGLLIVIWTLSVRYIAEPASELGSAWSGACWRKLRRGVANVQRTYHLPASIGADYGPECWVLRNATGAPPGGEPLLCRSEHEVLHRARAGRVVLARFGITAARDREAQHQGGHSK